jgi:hypothetical protein
MRRWMDLLVSAASCQKKPSASICRAPAISLSQTASKSASV